MMFAKSKCIYYYYPMTNVIYLFIISFIGDLGAYIFYQKYIESQKKEGVYLFFAILSAIVCWIFIFKIQDRGQTLRIFLPVWAAGSAVFGYFISGLYTKTPMKDLLSIPAIMSVLAIGCGIYFLQRLSSN